MEMTAADYSIPGMRIRVGGPGEQWALVVRSKTRQIDWVEELPSVVERISQPRVPTAIHYQDQFYRIDSAEQTENGWIYRMTVWPLNEPRLSIFELDRAHIQAEAAEASQLRVDVEKAHTAVVWAWLLGWLPSAIQNHLAEPMNFNPGDASRIQAFVQSVVCLGLTWLYIMTPPMGWIFFFITLEGSFRWMHTLVTREPCGFWLLEFVCGLAMRGLRLVKSQMKA